MDQIRDILDDSDVIPMSTLLVLGRKTLREAFPVGSPGLPLDKARQLWLKLQWTACTSGVVDTHLREACNAVCVFLRCMCRSTDDEVRRYAFSEKVWLQALEVVRKAFDDGKGKPALQVLEVLAHMLRENSSHENSKSILKNCITSLVRIILTGQPVLRLKEAIISLSLLLKKTQNVLPPAQYFDEIDLPAHATMKLRSQQAHLEGQQLENLLEDPVSEFLLALLLATNLPEPRTTAIKLFSLFCSKGDKIDMLQNVDAASLVIEIYLQVNPEALDDFSVDVFPAILNDLEQFDKFSKQFDLTEGYTPPRLSIYLAILKVGRQKGFLTEAELPGIVKIALAPGVTEADNKDESYAAFRSILMCDVPALRLQAFYLLIASNTPNAPVPNGVLKCIADSFQCLHDDTDAAYRDQYLAISRRFVTRLASGGKGLQCEEIPDTGPGRNTQADYDSFMHDWIVFLHLELSPQVSYQRHILALDVLRLVIPLSVLNRQQILPHQLFKNLALALLALVFDPFDDVRSGATSSLVLLFSYDQVLAASTLKQTKMLESAREMSANTGRADQADALGRIFMLYFLLDVLPTDSISDTSANMAQDSRYIRNLSEQLHNHIQQLDCLSPSSTFPIHGNLLGIAYIVRLPTRTPTDLDPQTVRSILNICTRIWLLVQRDLCVDSPETETHEDEQDGPEGPKDHLAYSWKALRDSSVLMQSLLETQAPNQPLYQAIGQLCLEQLINLRHRGAFSAVAHTFGLCCQKARVADDISCRMLNEPWLKTAFCEIDKQSSKLTRRSAGIPSLFVALLEPTKVQQFLGGVYELMDIAQKPTINIDSFVTHRSQLPQVHALNSLKDIMTNSRFRVITESLVVEMLNLAAQCLSSSIWAIRNCGLMLFRACVNRLTVESSNSYGTNVTTMQSTEIRTPLAVAINLLRVQRVHIQQDENLPIDEQESRQSEILFAALELLSKIPNQPESQTVIDEVIIAQFASKIWAVREHAARLQSSRTTIDCTIPLIETVLNQPGLCSSNNLHGHLLCCRHVFLRQWPEQGKKERNSTLHSLAGMFRHLVKAIPQPRCHPINLAAILDVLNDAFMYALTGKLDGDGIVDVSAMIRDLALRHTDIEKFFLLRRSLALNLVVEKIYLAASNSINHNETNQYYDNIMNLMQEQDVFTYVAQEVMHRISPSYPQEVLDIMLHYAPDCSSPDTNAAFLSIISTCLNSTQPQEAYLRLEETLRDMDLAHAENREVWNTQIQFTSSLYGCYTKSGLQLSPVLRTTLLECQRLSQQDEIEVPTRLCAINGIMAMVPAVIADHNMRNNGTQQAALQVSLLLYDFLNDDDEEIRLVAAKALCRFIQHADKLHYIPGLCTVAARTVLTDAMFLGHQNSEILIGHAYMRVIGARPSIGLRESDGIVMFCQTRKIRHLLDAALQRASELFVEERQNLYVDDLAEIKNWASLAKRCDLNKLGRRITEALDVWTVEGLEALTELIEVRSSKMSAEWAPSSQVVKGSLIHPVGLTYNTDVLTLFMRVVSLADLLLDSALFKEGCLFSVNPWIDSLRLTARLRALWRSFQNHAVHERVRSVVDKWFPHE